MADSCYPLNLTNCDSPQIPDTVFEFCNVGVEWLNFVSDGISVSIRLSLPFILISSF